MSRPPPDLSPRPHPQHVYCTSAVSLIIIPPSTLILSLTSILTSAPLESQTLLRPPPQHSNIRFPIVDRRASTMAAAGLIDPTKQSNYPVILGDALLGKPSNEIFTGIRCTKQPRAESFARTAY